VAIDSRGRIVVAGYNAHNVGDFALARYNPGGGLDRSFSRNGKKRTHFQAGALVNSVVIDSQDRIVAAGIGAYTNGVFDDFAVARYLGDAAPAVTISGRSKVRSRHRRARGEFSFTADEPATFECRVDSLEFRSCTSPYTTRKLAIGEHHFKVRATDLDGNRATRGKRLEIVRRR
jgi:hypothetical protein